MSNLQEILKNKGINNNDANDIISAFLANSIGNIRSRLYTVSNLSRNSIVIDVPNIKRGDVVWTYEDASNNKYEKKHVWNGRKSIKLDFTISYKYGSLPKEFTLNEFPDARYFDDSLHHDATRWLKFYANDIIKIVPGEYFIVQIQATDNKDYKYKIISTEKSSTRRKLYKELNFKNELLAVEGFDHMFSKTPSEELEYEHW